jgi:hypothetical protein
MKELSIEEKVDVRIFHNITIHFSKYGPRFKQLEDEDVFIWTERYSKIMQKHEFLTFEEPYQFLSEEDKSRVLGVGSLLGPEAYLMEEELNEGGKWDNIVSGSVIQDGEGNAGRNFRAQTRYGVPRQVRCEGKGLDSGDRL